LKAGFRFALPLLGRTLGRDRTAEGRAWLDPGKTVASPPVTSHRSKNLFSRTDLRVSAEWWETPPIDATQRSKKPQDHTGPANRPPCVPFCVVPSTGRSPSEGPPPTEPVRPHQGGLTVPRKVRLAINEAIADALQVLWRETRRVPSRHPPQVPALLAHCHHHGAAPSAGAPISPEAVRITGSNSPPRRFRVPSNHENNGCPIQCGTGAILEISVHNWRGCSQTANMLSTNRHTGGGKSP
jgi:hypothetical protein